MCTATIYCSFCILEAVELNDYEERHQILEAMRQAQAELEGLRAENAQLTGYGTMQNTLVACLCIAAAGLMYGHSGLASPLALAAGAWKLVQNRLT